MICCSQVNKNSEINQHIELNHELTFLLRNKPDYVNVHKIYDIINHFLFFTSTGAILYFLFKCFSLGICFFWYCSKDSIAYFLKSCKVKGFSSYYSLAFSSFNLIINSLG